MRLIINNKLQEFEDNQRNAKEILEIIKNGLNESGQELDCIIIDGKNIYSDYQNYITENISSIQEIIVKVNDLRSLVEETLMSSFDYIKNVIEMLERIADEFYQSPKKKTWGELGNLLEGIEWIMETLIRIDSIKNLKNILFNYNIWNEYVLEIKGLSEQIIQLEDAMVNQDNILIGDILLYEMLPSFKSAKEKLLFLIPTERTNHVS